MILFEEEQERLRLKENIVEDDQSSFQTRQNSAENEEFMSKFERAAKK